MVNRAAHRGGNKFQTERVHLKWRMSFVLSSGSEATEDWSDEDWSANVEDYNAEQRALLRAEFGDERLN